MDNARDVSCQSTVSAASAAQPLKSSITLARYRTPSAAAMPVDIAPLRHVFAVSHSRRSAPMVLLLATDLGCCGIGAVRLLNILNLTPPPFPCWGTPLNSLVCLASSGEIKNDSSVATHRHSTRPRHLCTCLPVTDTVIYRPPVKLYGSFLRPVWYRLQ